MTAQPLTTSQTIGPFFSPSLLRDDAQRNVLVQPDTAGERIRIEGRVLDGDRLPVADALVEIWQANAHGRYHHPADTGAAALDPAFTGFGRSGTDDEGRYWFETVRPGRVPFDDRRRQASHIVVTVFARGMLNHAVTRLYFGDDPATVDDPVLLRVPAERRSTLLATRHQSVGQPVYRFDIILQGEAETAFFNV
jgi:protocatechuate 3,4-dioxygenase alpha subunit